MNSLKVEVLPIFICLILSSLLFACEIGEAPSPTTDVHDTTESQDSYSPVDEDTTTPQDDVNPQNVQSDLYVEEDPCAVGYSPSLQLGVLNQQEMLFDVLETGDSLPFELGPQGSEMVVLDLVHRGTAGLNWNLWLEVRDVPTGELLITYESFFPGATPDPFTGEGPEDPMWSCAPTLGNLHRNLWLEGVALIEGKEVRLEAIATFVTGPDTEPLVLTFDVQGHLKRKL